MSGEAEVTLDVPFHDIDILGIVWHGHYYKYFELARTALYRSCHLDIQQMQEMGYIFPVIESQCRYVQPLRYGQQVNVRATFKKWLSYIDISYVLTDAESNQRMAYGYTKQAVCKSDGSMLLAVPDEVIDAISR
ncbi:MAG: acyl-CoA thioesterase [Mariprofundaceae bacterium]